MGGFQGVNLPLPFVFLDGQGGAFRCQHPVGKGFFRHIVRESVEGEVEVVEGEGEPVKGEGEPVEGEPIKGVAVPAKLPPE